MNKKIYLIAMLLLSIVFVNTNHVLAQTYCQPTTSCTFPDIITNVTFAGINRTSTCDGASTGGYSSWTSPTASVIQGQTYPISVSTGGDLEGIAVWIDYNHNFVYEASEVLFTPAYAATNPATYTANVIVPITAVPGNTGMRVRCKYSVAPSTTDNDPTCVNYTWGETEDYVVTIIAATPCSGTPVAGTAVATTTTPCPGASTTMSLTGSSLVAGLTYQWIRSNTGNAPWIVLPGATSNSYSAVIAGTKCYRCIVTCTTSGLFDTSSSVCVTTQTWSPTSSCYCTPTSNYSLTYYNISNFVLGTLANNTLTDPNNAPYFNNYTSFQTGSSPTLATPTIYAGITSNASVSLGSYTGEFAGLWIDYNHNGLFDAAEYYSTPSSTTVANGTLVIPILLPTSGVTQGITRMRVRGGDYLALTSSEACGYLSSNYYGETEDYLVNILIPTPLDPAVNTITGPTGNCFSNCESVSVNVTNYGSTALNTSTYPVTVNLNVNTPSGLVTYTQTLPAATTLNAYGANSVNVTFPCVNMYLGGTYKMNTTITLGGGGVNGILSNDSLMNPLTFINYRAIPGPDLHICQNAPIGFGQGLIATGCATPIHDSVEIVFTVTPCVDNIGATGTTGGTAQGAPQNCANVYACNFASAIIPTLPSGAYFTQNANYEVTNFSSGYPTEARFILFSGSTVGPIPTTNLVYPIAQGYQTPSIMGTGINSYTTGSYPYPCDYNRQVPPSVLSSIFSNQGSALNVGYWEYYNDYITASDITPNTPGITTVKMKVYYDYVPGVVNWYDNATSTTILNNVVPFNPISISNLSPSTQLVNTSIPGTYKFFATCAGGDCRDSVRLIIHPTPIAIQDTIASCEDAPGSNQATFDLTTLNNAISAGASGVTVNYFADQALLSPIQTPATDTTSTVFSYSKVSNAYGCYSSDSVLIQVNSIPQFSANVITGFACAPGTVDAASLIVFPTLPINVVTDTLYYDDPACTIPFVGDPHNISVVDTVYIVFKTQTTPFCSDTAVAYIDVTPALNLIINQVTAGNYSTSGTIPAVTNVLTDGQSQEYYSPTNCRKIAHITDLMNGTALGSTVISETIDATTQFYNTQPYVIRTYEITPTATTNTQANVCLYYLQDDIDLFNTDAVAAGWPAMTTSNMCITETHGGDYNTPGHTFTVIPNSALTISYDATTTVYTICFNADSFSHFYLHTQNPGNYALPVNLLSFTGKRVENTSVLKWITSNEQNNEYFVVERSKDNRNYTAISNRINSKATNGNSSAELSYEYTDAIPYEGHNYYRLQQVDRDGNQSSSKVVDVYFGDETMVTLYPNPVNSVLNVDINVVKATSAKMRIIDATGRVVKMIDMDLKSGGNTSKISMEGLADGMYMVTISNEKGLNYSQTIRKN